MSKRILITPRSLTHGSHPALRRLQEAGFELVFCTPGKQPDEKELLRLLPGCVGFLAGVEKVSQRVLEAAPGLRVISRNGVGVDNVDLAAAKRLGISVRLALARWVPFSDQVVKAGGWERRKGIELAGKTLGLVGCGSVGRLVANLALGFGMKVLACDVMPDPAFAPSPDFRYAPFEELLGASDVISLHCPATADGKPLLDAAALSRMKKGVLLVNTARAGLVDNAALAAALQSGQVAGAATDVFTTEPPAGDPLVVSDRVIATPHIGGFTEESVDRAVELAVDNLLAELKPVRQTA